MVNVPSALLQVQQKELGAAVQTGTLSIDGEEKSFLQKGMMMAHWL